MNRNTKIPLGKKDMVLRKWWDEVSTDAQVSQPICLAIAYYAKTGNFMQIGTYTGTVREFENTVKYIYIPENSIAFNFLEKKQSEGERVASHVKYILRNSLTKGMKNAVYNVDELRSQLESLSHTEIRYIEKPVLPKAVEVREQPQYEESKPAQVQATYQVNNEPEDDGDLISALLGDAGFEI